jgi:hypothetical protein
MKIYDIGGYEETVLNLKLLPSIIRIYNIHIKEREPIATCCKASGDTELRTAGTVTSQ